MVIRRGEIWWADLPAPAGSEPGYRRPILITQSDDFNESAISTIIGVTISSNLRLADASGNVFVPRRESGLKKDSVVNVSQIVTLDKRALGPRVKRLPAERVREVEEGLRLVLNL